MMLTSVWIGRNIGRKGGGNVVVVRGEEVGVRMDRERWKGDKSQSSLKRHIMDMAKFLVEDVLQDF